MLVFSYILIVQDATAVIAVIAIIVRYHGMLHVKYQRNFNYWIFNKPLWPSG